MTIREVYDFPDDDGETLERVLDALPGSILREMEERPCGAWVVSMQSTDAMALLLAVRDPDLLLLDNGDVYVPDNARRECLDALSRGSITVVKWRRLHAIEFRSKAAQAAFERYSKTPSADWRTSS